ncbi:hypothetical protein C0Q70_19474 [Pomacea canaliculata]|uniref:Bee-milk protein n=1 Tax=Pomacea canaliculata TaxID=400727 RepID=A0A2T7NJF3_POMCA|nr:hypothetical protein C0Q70_19474 [Pomacea canaliculata]
MLFTSERRRQKNRVRNLAFGPSQVRSQCLYALLGLLCKMALLSEPCLRRGWFIGCLSLTALIFTLPMLSVRGDVVELFVTNGTDVLRIDKETKTHESLYHQPGGRIVGLAADTDDGVLFWSDISEQYRAIYKSWTDGNGVQIIITGVVECNGLSVDWISNHIYWTDAGKLTVEIANYDGSGRRILIGYNLQIPRGIVVDPVFGAGMQSEEEFYHQPYRLQVITP